MDNQPPLSRWEEGENGKICAVDIDGVLNDYPDCWLRYINTYNTPGKIFHNLVQAKNEIPYEVYRNLKRQYRELGEAKTFREGADVFMGALLQKYKVILITARPFYKFPKLYSQTQEWLKENNIPYDYLISSKEKHVEVIRQFPHLKFMIEDNRYIANLVAKWGYKVFLFDNVYNQGDILPNVTRVHSFEEIHI